jgi:hypothetical protein
MTKTFVQVTGVLLIILGIIFAISYTMVITESWVKDKMGYETLGRDAHLERACTVTQTVATVGHQVSTTVLAANSQRAWATIRQPQNATNTVSLGFGTAASAVTGLQLYTPASTSESYTFGKKTDFPFTGAVNGLTSTGSTTVKVVQCVY